nr:RHS repeat-associated core domain-containing protein [Polycladospora coralii]
MSGENQKEAFTGHRKAMYNPYRYTGKRWDDDTETYDMGFRNYNPSIARFDTRDMYADAAQDIGLAMSLANMTRYAFTGGNPISYSDLDGHFQAQAGGTGRAINDKIVQAPTMANPKPDYCTRASCGSTKKTKKVVDLSQLKKTGRTRPKMVSKQVQRQFKPV